MLLQASGLLKSYGSTVIFAQLSLQIQARQRIGLIGPNGAGKSTLLRILAGESSYDEGQLFVAKATTIGYLAQNSGLQSNQTIEQEMRSIFTELYSIEQQLRQLEHQIAELSPSSNESLEHKILSNYATLSDDFRERGGFAIEANIRGVLHGMGFKDTSPTTLVSSLSGGQKTRLALAKLLLQKPDLLLLDEPTNHLDMDTLAWLESYLRNYPGAIMVVSHDRYFLDALVDTVYEMDRTACRRYTGNYSRYLELKSAEYEQQMKAYERQQSEIVRQEQFIQRNIARASTTRRAQSRRTWLERIERLDKPGQALRKMGVHFDIEEMSGQDVLEVQNLSTPIFQHVQLRLRRGDSAAVIGPNGIGKSTLLKVILGMQSAQAGTIHWGANVTIGYYDQEQADLISNQTVLEEVWNSYPLEEEVRIRTVLGHFLFSGDDVLKKIATLSGGEKARVALAKLMLRKANVLILDEPTNHLDLASKEVLESALMEYEGTLIFVSHDRYFLNRMADHIYELQSDGLSHFLGNYDDYVLKKQEKKEILNNQASSSAKIQASPSAITTYESEKLAKKEERQRLRRMEQLELMIAALESEVSNIETQLADPIIYHNYVTVQQLQAKIEEMKAQLTQHYKEWETLLI